MPLDVLGSVLQKEINKPRKQVMKELRSAVKTNGIRSLFVGTKWRIAATTIEVYLFNQFLAFYKRQD
jgi:hypothetical protein